MMTDNEKAIALSCVRWVGSVFCVFILSIAAYYGSRNVVAMMKGYSQKTLPGQNGVHWVAPVEVDIK